MCLMHIEHSEGVNFVHPYQGAGKRGVTVSMRRKIYQNLACFPAASLYSYHTRIAVATCPIARGLTPWMVHTSQRTELKISLK